MVYSAIINVMIKAARLLGTDNLLVVPGSVYAPAREALHQAHEGLMEFSPATCVAAIASLMRRAT